MDHSNKKSSQTNQRNKQTTVNKHKPSTDAAPVRRKQISQQSDDSHKRISLQDAPVKKTTSQRRSKTGQRPQQGSPQGETMKHRQKEAASQTKRRTTQPSRKKSTTQDQPTVSQQKKKDASPIRKNAPKNPKSQKKISPQTAPQKKELSERAKRKAQRRREERKLENFRNDVHRGPDMTPPRKKRRKMNPIIFRILCIVLVLLVLFIGFCIWQVRSDLNAKLRNSALLEKYHISTEAAEAARSHRVVNILLFGLDGRDEEDVEGDRSDSMMICTADYENNCFKVTSLMRDTYTYIPAEEDYDKLNAAYSLGGAEGAIAAVNTNFDTAITDYVAVNFDCLIYMVDAVGGVEINIEDEDERYWADAYNATLCATQGFTYTPISQVGTQTLNGIQALSYCRVRYAGRGDYDRTQRQRNVLEQVMGKVFKLNPIKQYNLMMKVLPYIETSLSMDEITKYALNVLMMNGHSLDQMRLPADGLGDDGERYGISYVYPDTLEDNIKAWYQFVYNIDITLSQRTQAISDEIAYIWSWW